MPARKAAEPETTEDQVAEEAPAVEETLAAGAGSMDRVADPATDEVYLWASPGTLIVAEDTSGKPPLRGDVAVGTVFITHEDDDRFHGMPVIYIPRKAPQLIRGTSAFAVVKVEDVVGFASNNPTLMVRTSPVAERPAYEPNELDDLGLYRSSDQTVSSNGSPFAGSGPFDSFGS